MGSANVGNMIYGIDLLMSAIKSSVSRGELQSQIKWSMYVEVVGVILRRTEEHVNLDCNYLIFKTPTLTDLCILGK